MALTKITSRILDSSGVTILGTIATGVWQGTAINQTYLVGQSGTNTGDETLARINALDVTELGTISSGVWQGSVIAEAYLQNQSGTNTGDQTTISGNAGSVTNGVYTVGNQTIGGTKTFSDSVTVNGPRYLVQRSNDDSSIAFANNASGSPSSHTWAVGLNYSNSNAFTIAYGSSGIPSLESSKLVMTTGGNVGIGTTSPNAKLKVEGNAATNGLSIKSAGNGGTYPFMVTWSGGSEGDAFCVDDSLNVGIGTNSPSSRLDITATRTAQLTLIELSTNTLSSANDDEISIDFGRGLLNKYSARISGYISNYSTYDGGLKFYTSSGGTLNTTPQLTIESGGAATFGGTVTSTSGFLGNATTSSRFKSTSQSSATATNANLLYTGIHMNYYSSGTVSNTASGGYGTIISFGGSGGGVAGSLQLQAVLTHNSSTAATNSLYYRIGNNLGYSNDWRAFTYSSVSDYRLKENIKPMSSVIDRIKLMNAVSFNFINEPDKEVEGFIAHEVQEIIPEAVLNEKDKVGSNGTPMYQSIDYSKITPFLIKAIQEQQAQIELLKQEVELLKQ